MSSIEFSKEQLNDLKFALSKEIIQTNKFGTYCSSTLANCNTRKYHGLLVAAQPKIDSNKHVLLSALDETILTEGKTIRLGTHCYPNAVYPQGYLQLDDFIYERLPKWTIKTDSIELKKEIMLAADESRVFIRYIVKESKKTFTLRIDPFLAFRNIHKISKSNSSVNQTYHEIENGIKLNIYPNYDTLFIQFSKKNAFSADPHWYYNNEYNQELERGYEYSEDLYSPGYFLITLKKGDHLIFSAALNEISPKKLKGKFEAQLLMSRSLKNFSDYLEHAAQQFIIETKKGTEIIAGFHWFEQWGRDTFIALPGLTLSLKQPKLCKAVLDTQLKELNLGLFPNVGEGDKASYNTADASLWFFWALQQYAYHTKSLSKIWSEYGTQMRSILEHYRNGTMHHIHMIENGLLYAGEKGFAITWMDALVKGEPVTPRIGLAVELNALWYNAICFSIEAAKLAKDDKFLSEWEALLPLFRIAFKATFWNEEKGYLADVVNNENADWSLRPNQIFAVSLPYSPIDQEIKRSLLEKVKEKLLTPRGLRTLSPEDLNYKGSYHGDQTERDRAYHQGTVWPWLLGHYAEACLNVFGINAKQELTRLYKNFEPAMLEYGLGTIAEIYEGNAPHQARGAISQAWSVAELLRMRNMLGSNNKKTNQLKKSSLMTE